MAIQYFYNDNINVRGDTNLLSMFIADCINRYDRDRRASSYPSGIGSYSLQTRYGLDSTVLINNNLVPVSGDIVSNAPNQCLEQFMAFGSALAEKHGWEEFDWQRMAPHSGLESFTPSTGTPYNMNGYGTMSMEFWDQFSDVYNTIYENTGSLLPFVSGGAIPPPIIELVDGTSFTTFPALRSKTSSYYYSLLVQRFQTGDLIPDYIANYHRTINISASGDPSYIVGPKITKLRQITTFVYPYSNTGVAEWVDAPNQQITVANIGDDLYDLARIRLAQQEWQAGFGTAGTFYPTTTTIATTVLEPEIYAFWPSYKDPAKQTTGRITQLLEENEVPNPGGSPRREWIVAVEYDEQFLLDGFPKIAEVNSVCAVVTGEGMNIRAFNVKKDGIKSHFGVDEIEDLIVNMILYPANLPVSFPEGSDPMDYDGRMYGGRLLNIAQYTSEDIQFETGVQLGTRVEDEFLERYEFDNDELVTAEAQGDLSDLPDMFRQEHDEDFRVWIRIRALPSEPAPLNHNAFQSSTWLYFGVSWYDDDNFLPYGGNPIHMNNWMPGEGVAMGLPPVVVSFEANNSRLSQTTYAKIEDYDQSATDDRLYVCRGHETLNNRLASGGDMFVYGERVGPPINVSFVIS